MLRQLEVKCAPIPVGVGSACCQLSRTKGCETARNIKIDTLFIVS